jgi:outer membrane protein
MIRNVLLTACLCLGSIPLAHAADLPTKIGILDWQQLLSKAPQAESAGKRLEKEFQAPKEKLDNKQKEFLAKRDKMQRNKDVMSVQDRAKHEKELAKMEQDLRRMDEELRTDYTTRHREEMDAFIAVVREVVEKFSEEEKFDVVLSQEATLYVSTRVDITEKVLERLEKEAKNNKGDKKDKKSTE